MSDITISKSGIKTEFETLLYKYGNAIENADNDKAVYNVKSDRVFSNGDALVVDNAFDKRLKEVLSLMHDFEATATTSGDNVIVSFTMTSRWAGTTVTLLSLVETYILDGMMVDWLNVTAPSEAAIFAARLPQDITDIKVELYTKKQP